MSFLQRLSSAMKREINVILAVATYENHRKASGSSLGNWESILTPLQIMLFFVAMRLGFSFVRGSNRLAAGGSTDMYFNIIIFIASGFAIAFLFRQIAVKALTAICLKRKAIANPEAIKMMILKYISVEPPAANRLLPLTKLKPKRIATKNSMICNGVRMLSQLPREDPEAFR